MEQSTVDRNRAQQAAWYGEPVGDTVKRLLPALGLTQAQLAAVVGVSAPMLSQLASGQRAKIANPTVLVRLQALRGLADDPGLGELSRAELGRRTQAVRELEPTGVYGTTQLAAPAGPAPVQALLRAVATPEELARAADALAGQHAGLAEVLRVYGLGTSDEAETHWAGAVGPVA